MHLILTLCLSLSPQITSQGPPEPEPRSGRRTPLPPAGELQVGSSTPRGSLVLWRSPNPPAGYRSTPWFVRPESAAVSWRDEDPYPTPTSWMASAVMGERLYVFGGWNIVSGHARIVTSYAPGRGWRSEATMLVPPRSRKSERSAGSPTTATTMAKTVQSPAAPSRKTVPRAALKRPMKRPEVGYEEI